MYSSKPLSNKQTKLILNLYISPGAENNFPQDKLGTYSIKYGLKSYKFQAHVLSFSDFLCKHFDKKPNLKVLNLKLNYTQSEQALDLIMKLLFGFKEIIIPEQEYLDVLAIIYEMSTHTMLFYQND